MTRAILIWVFLAGCMAISCVERATPDELNQMCENLIKLRAKLTIPDINVLQDKVEKEFAAEEERQQNNLKQALAALDEEMNAKMGELKKDEEKEALMQETEKKKQEKTDELTPAINALAGEKEAALKDAAMKAREAQSDWDDAVNECLADAKKEGTAKEVAQCRAGATSTDQYWNKCR